MAEATHTNVDEWNFSEWSCYESYDRSSLLQRISYLLEDRRFSISQFYPLENVVILAFYFPLVANRRLDTIDHSSINTKIGLYNYLKHVKPVDVQSAIKQASVKNDYSVRVQTPVPMIGYDIGDRIVHLKSSRVNLFPKDGSVIYCEQSKFYDTPVSAFTSIQKVR